MVAVIAMALLWWLSFAYTAWVPRRSARRSVRLTPSIDVPSVVVVLSPGCLRFHDNPCLKYVASHGTERRTVPILWPDDCIPQGIRHSLSCQFNQAGGSLLSCSNVNLPNLVAQLKKAHPIQEVVYCRSPARPFQLHADRLMSVVRELGCKVTEVDDSTLPTHLGAGYDLKDLTFDKFRLVLHRLLSLSKPVMSYPALLFPTITRETFPGLYPFVVSPTPAAASGDDLCREEEALNCVRRYLSEGDDIFSRATDVYQAYLSSASSPELELALQRQVTLSTHSFFPGEVVSALLSNAFAIGSLSPRVAFHSQSAILQQEVVRREWHSFLARTTSSYSSNSSNGRSRWNISFYHWNGYLCRMGVLRQPVPVEDPGDEIGDESDLRPDLVLVHGFSGSLDQFTDVACQLLASQRFRSIYAVDSIGFGLSEKPPLSWNQFHWRDHLLDFLRHHLEHNTSRVILAGNSLGGYAVAAVAAELSPSTSPLSSPPSSGQEKGGKITCQGVVLFNPSGEVLPNDRPQLLLNRTRSALAAFFSPPSSPSLFSLKTPLFLLRLFGLAVYAVLQPRIRQVCRWLYPARPDRVDISHVASHIYRDSCDPGGAGILASAGKLPPAESMNSLFHRFTGPVLLLQGVLDPMLNATHRAMEFAGMRRPKEPVEVKLLQLGHCPMDEDPALVAKEMLEWGARRQLF